jgi:hypothetical protein
VPQKSWLAVRCDESGVLEATAHAAEGFADSKGVEHTPTAAVELKLPDSLVKGLQEVLAKEAPNLKRALARGSSRLVDRLESAYESGLTLTGQVAQDGGMKAG